MQDRSYTDRTFDMLCDMIPEKVERYIFLPHLRALLEKCSASGTDEEYWTFLEDQYPVLYYQEGETGDTYFNEAQSFIYRKILEFKHLGGLVDLDFLDWPSLIYDLPTKESVRVYEYFLDEDVYERFQNQEEIAESLMDDTTVAFEEDVPYQYNYLFGKPEQTGITIEIEIYQLTHNPGKYKILRDFMEDSGFPLAEEYQNIKRYYDELRASIQKEDESDDLFDD